MTYPLLYKEFGEHAILIEWPKSIDDKILNDIINFKLAINTHLNPSLIELIPAYNSLTVINHNKNHSLLMLKEKLKDIYITIRENPERTQKLWTIPVCYDTSFGIDIDYFCEQKKITKKKLIQLHSKTVYTVYCIGFLPGFMYLGGLPESLEMPRRKVPRLHILKGAVGIAGNQTGVYPQESPGGWNIIGNSPIHLFNANNHKPCFVETGDKIQFKSISLAEHKSIQEEVDAGVFSIDSKRIHQ